MFEAAWWDSRRLGLAAGVGAVALGLCYLAAAGAPVRHLALNGAALLVGLAAYATVVVPRWRLGGTGALAAPALGSLLLATALLAPAVGGAARWVAVGPLTLQVSLIVLPAMLVRFASRPNGAGAAGLLIAALALALQPDRAMAGVAVAGLATLAVLRRDRLIRLTLAAAAAAFAAALATPDRLPAVPFVDGILFSSFAIHPLIGAGVAGGAALLALPALAGWRERQAPSLVFGAVWAAAVLAAALGNYPTPLVGYGGSAIVGYLLSLALLPAGAADAALDRHGQGNPNPERGDPSLFARLT